MGFGWVCVLRIPYPYSVSGGLGGVPYSVFRIRIPYCEVWDVFRTPYSVSVFRIGRFGRGSVLRIPYPYSVSGGLAFGRCSVFRICIPYPYSVSVFRIRICEPVLHTGEHNTPSLIPPKRKEPPPSRAPAHCNRTQRGRPKTEYGIRNTERHSNTQCALGGVNKYLHLTGIHSTQCRNTLKGQVCIFLV